MTPEAMAQAELPVPLIFAVPVVARSQCKDWEVVQWNLRRTVKSIRQNTSPNFRIVLACNELPELEEPGLGDIDILVVPFGPELNVSKQGEDKARKRRYIASWLRKTLDVPACYIMMLDADDLISRELVAYVTADNNRRSYVAEKGYIYDCSTGLLHRIEEGFSRYCGSGFIGYFEKNALPRDIEDLESVFSRFGVAPSQNPLMVGHKEYARLAAEVGIPADALPFPAIVYMANHQESLRLRRIGWRRIGVLPGLIAPLAAHRILAHDFAAPDVAPPAAPLTAAAMFARGLARACLHELRAQRSQRRYGAE